MAPTRRTVLCGAGAALGAATIPPTAACLETARQDQAGPSLAQVALAQGLKFGSALGGPAYGDKAYRDLFLRQCAVMTPENALKWQALRPSVERFEFRAADRLFSWARQNQIEVRGHTLLWPRADRLPDWVTRHDFGRKPREEAEYVVGRHVVAVMERYGDQTPSIDVVNEAVDPQSGAYRQSVLSQAAGSLDSLMDLAFQLSRQISPRSQLVYNDYMDWGDGSRAHRLGVLKLLEGFRRRGTPVDALGVQAHVTAAADPGAVVRRERHWRSFLDEVTGMGYQLVVTEFDVDDRELEGDAARRDAEVAAYARAYTDLILSYGQTNAFLTWGLSDRYSWLHDFRPRGDGLRKRGCLYDEALAPKPVRQALLQAFAQAPPRLASAPPPSSGRP